MKGFPANQLGQTLILVAIGQIIWQNKTCCNAQLRTDLRRRPHVESVTTLVEQKLRKSREASHGCWMSRSRKKALTYLSSFLSKVGKSAVPSPKRTQSLSTDKLGSLPSSTPRSSRKDWRGSHRKEQLIPYKKNKKPMKAYDPHKKQQ